MIITTLENKSVNFFRIVHREIKTLKNISKPNVKVIWSKRNGQFRRKIKKAMSRGGNTQEENGIYHQI